MPEQIFYLDILAGKVIDRAFAVENPATTAVGLVFTDGSFFRLAGEPGDYDEESPQICWHLRPASLDEKAEFGLISAADLESRKAAAAAEEQARHLARERAEYERLRAKFEPGPTP
jgi:enoyl-CoA hydratase/carnithine racemase